MKPMRTTRVIAILAASVSALVAVPAGPGAAEVTVKGDTAAWQEVVAAYRKLNELPGYRMKMAMANGQTMVMEFAQGGTAIHMTTQGSGAGMEMVKVGDQIRFRMDAAGAPAGWRCQGMPSLPSMSDPTSVQGTIDVARGPAASIDGQSMRTYVYTVQTSVGGSAGNVKQTLYVGADSGLPRRLMLASPRGEQTLDIYDYGAPIQITLPPCGGASQPRSPDA